MLGLIWKVLKEKILDKNKLSQLLPWIQVSYSIDNIDITIIANANVIIWTILRVLISRLLLYIKVKKELLF